MGLKAKNFIFSIGIAICLYSVVGLFLAYNFRVLAQGILNSVTLIFSFYLMYMGEKNKEYRITSKPPIINFLFCVDGLVGVVLFFIYLYVGYVLTPSLMF